MKLAVIVPVFNEEVMLPQFMDYYSPQVDTIFVLDNQSDDATVAIASRYPKAVIRTFNTEGTFNSWVQHQEIMKLRKECIGKFDFVIIVDCDEWVYPKKKLSLKGALQELPPAEIYGTHGFNMFQALSEAPYDPKVPLLDQRKYGCFAPRYCKPVIIRPESKIEFGVGRHEAVGVDKPDIKDPNLAAFYFLHYLGIDEDLWVKRRLDGRIKRIADESKRRRLDVAFWEGSILDEKSLREQFSWPRKDPKLGLMKVL